MNTVFIIANTIVSGLGAVAIAYGVHNFFFALRRVRDAQLQLSLMKGAAYLTGFGVALVALALWSSV